MIKDVIRLKWEAQLSHESIAAALGVSTYIPHFDSRNSGELAAPGGTDG
ncbi:MAG: hypothetical protein M5U30_20655 [Burkholderiaceae bacterium]|nr:hypothetical protein [Burkholderiaceae bacterium]